MISRKLFFKMTWEEIKGRLATILLSMLIFFIVMPTGFLFYMENAGDVRGSELQNYMAGIMGLLFVILFVLAVVSGINAFNYLHVRKKVDFYHSFPIKREVLFGMKYVIGIITVIIPYMIQLILMYGMALMQGYFQDTDIKAFFIDLIVKVVAFILVYTVTVLAMVMTGQLITAICGTGVFLGYAGIWGSVIVAYIQSYFSTYSYMGEYEGVWYNVLQYFSPMTYYISMAGKSVQYLNDDRIILCFPEFEVLIACIMIVVCFCISIVLYHFRPSESAGKAIAFKKSETGIKVAVVVLATITISLIMRLMASVHPDMGMIFGFLLGSIFFAGFMEAIFRSDVRAIFQKKKQLLLCMGIAGIFIAVFRLDLIGYDNWIPDKKDVESLALCIGDNYEMTDCYEQDGFMTTEEYILKYMKLKEDTIAYSLVKNGIKETKNSESNRITTNVTVKYNMKNGIVKYRDYQIDFSKEENWKIYNALYEEEEFQKGIFPILKEETCENQVVVQYGITSDEDLVNYNDMAKKIDLTEEQCKELYAVYRMELADFTPEKQKGEKIIGFLGWLDKNNYIDEYYRNAYPVYESFVATQTLLESYGLSFYELPVEKVEEVIINNLYTGNSYAYTEKEQIEELCKWFVNYEYSYVPDVYTNENEDMFDIQVIVKTGEEDSVSYGRKAYMNGGQIPDFLKQDIESSDPAVIPVEDMTVAAPVS